MKYKVSMKAKCKKALEKMPKSERLIFAKFIDDLRTTGPVQPGYRNYSKLGKGKYLAT